jgi:hypothetical protein
MKYLLFTIKSKTKQLDHTRLFNPYNVRSNVSNSLTWTLLPTVPKETRIDVKVFLAHKNEEKQQRFHRKMTKVRDNKQEISIGYLTGKIK